MLGVIVNSISICIGGLIGLVFKNLIKESYKETVMNGIGLCVILIGITSAIKTKSMLPIIISIVIGSLIGEMLNIEEKLNNLGDWIGEKFSKEGGSFSKGFVTTTLIFCVGAMSIVGSLESGLKGSHDTLYAKSILDGVTSIVFGSTLGIGVAFSSISVLIYQGLIVLSASMVKDFFTPQMINEVSALGGLLIIAIGINILNIKKIKIGNMIPSLIIILMYYALV